MHTQRTELLRKLVEATTGDDRDMWLLQLIDSGVAAAQKADGTTDRESLAKLLKEVQAATENQEIIGQAKFNSLTADYSDSLLATQGRFRGDPVQVDQELESFVKEFAETRPAAEAICSWRSPMNSPARTTKRSPGTVRSSRTSRTPRWLRRPWEPSGDCSRSASHSNCAGKDWMVGRWMSPTLRGNLVLVHYWATWCEPCKQDMKQLRQLLTRISDVNSPSWASISTDQPQGGRQVLEVRADVLASTARSGRLGKPPGKANGDLHPARHAVD